MSLSDQHPYTLFVAGGLRSPSLAKARVEVGDNADAYLASADVVTFLGRTQPSPPVAGRRVYSRNGVCEEQGSGDLDQSGFHLIPDGWGRIPVSCLGKGCCLL